MSRAARPAIDLSALPDHACGPASLGWWGVLGFILIEGMGFVLLAGSYFYLVPFEQRWPPASPPPDLLWGTIFTIVAIASEWPNAMAARAAKAGNREMARSMLLVMVALGLLLVGIRFAEFAHLNVGWEDNAYGSILWATIVVHAFHLITDLYDSAVLAAIAHVKGLDGRRLSDVDDNTMYWHFIVWSWVALYVLLYWVPRWR
ncbi:MAG TPA: cytochrome c oxidase subunit 3 [Xanthomonadales bacterium]|nr:cytochrome c oxidase subunit 3 [Xanthomonadales bacterium]